MLQVEATESEFQSSAAGASEVVQPDVFQPVSAHFAGCGCSACLSEPDDSELNRVSPLDANIDGQGGVFNGKPVWTLEQVAAHLNRTGVNWTPGANNAVPESGGAEVIRFGFFETQAQTLENGYGYEFNGQLYAFNEYFNFATFSEAQRGATREAMQGWDDVIATTFVETSADDADINFGNLLNAPTTQAYARLPYATITSNPALNAQVAEIAGDVWVSTNQASNFQLDEGLYGIHTLVHEAGHALGLSHPGAYNAAPGLSITYPNNAEYAQDTRAYTVMSYFNASSLGARHFDFNMSTTVYAATPLIHDIAAAQRIYGADPTTRTGDTTYGFNSNAGRDSYDFDKTPAPIMAIYDAGGNDTLDASGYDTTQLIDLTPGALSSIGGVTAASAPTFEQTNANRASAGYAPITRTSYDANLAALTANPNVGRLTDNVGIAYGVTIENAVGGSGADAIIGNGANNRLTGAAGDDVLLGRDGVDTLDGGVGNDVLDGGSGADVMTGGAGNDAYVVDAGDRITEARNEGTDEVRTLLAEFRLATNFENLTGLAETGQRLTGNVVDNVITGGAGADTLDGSTGNDSLNGGAGGDSLLGGSGDDRLRGQDGTDVLAGGSGSDNLAGDAGEDSLSGGADADVLNGGAEADAIDGGSGADIIIGGLGDDVLSGGSGADIFLFGPGFGDDRITDFGSGDLLDWSAMTLAGFTASVERSGADTLISFDDGSSILLGGVSGSLGGAWFTDQPSSASGWLLA